MIKVCLVISTFNNFDEFVATFKDVYIDNPCILYAISDSSSDDRVRSFVSNLESKNVVYFWSAPEGIYSSLNYALNKLALPPDWFVNICNSGDSLSEDWYEILLCCHSEKLAADILCFEQIAFFPEDDNVNCKITPQECGVWPHQAIFYRSELHDKFGYYDNSFKYAADQLFFAKVRREVDFFICKYPISYFKYGGISSNVNLRHGVEIYKVWYLLSGSILLSSFKFLSSFFKLFLSRKRLMKLRKLYYRS